MADEQVKNTTSEEPVDSSDEENVPLAKRIKRDKADADPCPNGRTGRGPVEESDDELELESLLNSEDLPMEEDVTTDILRGIMDSLPIGRNFSPQFCFTKHLLTQTKWMRRVQEVGILKTTQVISKKYEGLSESKKVYSITRAKEQEPFVEESKIKAKRFDQEQCVPVRERIGIGGIRPAIFLADPKDPDYFLNEPKPPPPKLLEFHFKLMSNKIQKGLAPKWTKMSVSEKMYYMKKYYASTQAYLQNYETFIHRMSPPQLLSYVAFLYEKWSKTNLEPQRQCRQNFIFPVPNINPDDERRKNLRKVTTNENKNGPPPPNIQQPLDNNQFIAWLAKP